jgi:hypothetical protein
VKGANYSKSSGDEAGTAKGIMSSKNMGKATPLLYSFDVKLDGKNAQRLTDMMDGNG